MINTMLGKSLKFTLLLSITTMMSLQTGHAGKMYCPSAHAIEVKQLPNGNWEYTGVSTGDRAVIFKAESPQKLTLHGGGSALKPGAVLECNYHGNLLTSNDAGAIQDCNVEEEYFECK